MLILRLKKFLRYIPLVGCRGRQERGAWLFVARPTLVSGVNLDFDNDMEAAYSLRPVSIRYHF